MTKSSRPSTLSRRLESRSKSLMRADPHADDEMSVYQTCRGAAIMSDDAKAALKAIVTRNGIKRDDITLKLAELAEERDDASSTIITSKHELQTVQVLEKKGSMFSMFSGPPLDFCVRWTDESIFKAEANTTQEDYNPRAIEAISFSWDSFVSSTSYQSQLAEVDGDNNPTHLYKSLQQKEWLHVKAILKAETEEAKTWVYKKERKASWFFGAETEGKVLRRDLPVHVACQNAAPQNVIEMLIGAFPDGARMKNGDGQLPLHIACQSGSDPEALSSLLSIYPEACIIRDNEGTLPIDVARKSTTEYKEKILTAMMLYTGVMSLVVNSEKKLAFEPYAQDVDYDKNPTLLHELIRKGQWIDAINRVKLAPIEAKTWVFRKEKASSWLFSMPKEEARGEQIRWRILPLHAACVFHAPQILIEALVSAYPDSTKMADDGGRLPIHIACFSGPDDQGVMATLLNSYPESCNVMDEKGRFPIDHAMQSASPNKRETVATLRAFTNVHGLGRVVSAERGILQDDQRSRYSTGPKESNSVHSRSARSTIRSRSRSIPSVPTVHSDISDEIASSSPVPIERIERTSSSTKINRTGSYINRSSSNINRTGSNIKSQSSGEIKDGILVSVLSNCTVLSDELVDKEKEGNAGTEVWPENGDMPKKKRNGSVDGRSTRSGKTNRSTKTERTAKTNRSTKTDRSELSRGNKSGFTSGEGSKRTHGSGKSSKKDFVKAMNALADYSVKKELKKTTSVSSDDSFFNSVGGENERRAATLQYQRTIVAKELNKNSLKQQQENDRHDNIRNSRNDDQNESARSPPSPPPTTQPQVTQPQTANTKTIVNNKKKINKGLKEDKPLPTKVKQKKSGFSKKMLRSNRKKVARE